MSEIRNDFPAMDRPISILSMMHCSCCKRVLSPMQARNLQTECQELQESGSAFDLELQRLSGRFHFVQSLYLAHSVSEDEVLFPALEAKHSLRNVSKFYVLDHEHEGQLFAELESTIHGLQDMVRLLHLHCTGDWRVIPFALTTHTVKLMPTQHGAFQPVSFTGCNGFSLVGIIPTTVRTPLSNQVWHSTCSGTHKLNVAGENKTLQLSTARRARGVQV